MDKNSKMANKNLRRAMMYAVDIDAVAKKFGNGLSWRANTLIPPVFKDVYDSKAAGFPYNMKKAKSLLIKPDIRSTVSGGLIQTARSWYPSWCHEQFIIY